VAAEQADTSELPTARSAATVAVNAGLWLEDPDVDAITRLALRPTALSAKPISVVLGSDTWAPINTQNTAIVGPAIAAYYYVRMGFPLQGMHIDRYGDILSGYFVEACAKHLGDLVRFGNPVADHRRTPHNLFEDLYHELGGMMVIEDLVPWLREVPLSGSTYAETYASLADAVIEQAHSFKGFIWDQGGREFLLETGRCMQRWHDALRVLGTG
jgi:hypothetical protein